MKLIILLTVVACLHASAGGYAQKLTISKQNVSLEVIFKEIKKQTGYNFLYNYDWLQGTKPVTISVKDATLEQVLDICFKDQPLTYAIVDKTIALRKKTISREEQVTESSSQIDVHGRVIDENGKPVSGVTVTIKGTKTATSTNENGEFSFKTIDKSATLIFTSVNMEAFEIKVENRSDFLVNLKTKVSGLDEVQIIAYGTTTQRLNTGNVSTVKAEDIEKQPINDPLLALEGRVPGLFITQSSGLPGATVTVRIQGQNSIQSGNDPLYVIDGVPYSSQVLPTTYAPQWGGGGTGSTFSFINPGDIESIAILKDADATAIYGSRAANGAILITTKKGKTGQTRVDINLQNGWGQVTRKLDLLNTQQYLQMRHEAIANDGLTTAPTDYDINGLWDTTSYTDWQKTLIGGTAQYTNINASVSGGTETTQYLIGSTYHRETLVFPGGFADQKGSVHFNLNNVSLNQKFRIQLSGNYLVDNNHLPTNDLTADAITNPPDAPPLYNANGSINWMPDASGNTTYYNPIAYGYNPYTNKTNNLLSNAVLSYRVLPGLDIRSSFGYTNLQTNEFLGFPLITQPPESRPTSTRAATYTNNNINSWIIEPQATFKQNIWKGKLEALVGTTIQQQNSNGKQLNGFGYNSDAVLEDIASAADVLVGSTTSSIYKYNAVFGRINYNLQDKFIINLTARRDGSSRFGHRNQFHNFGSVGVGWIFSQENIVQNNLSFISFGKLRGSYGTTGNDQIGDYQFMSLYRPYTQNVNVAYQNTPALIVRNIPNPYLQWEETRKLQFGLDLGFFKDRILLTANYVHNSSSNQLLGYKLPVITGFGAITENFPATVQNTAWEFLLNTVNVKSRNFTWTSSLNLTIPRNKLVAFPNLATSSYASFLTIGQPLNIQKVFHLIGVNDTTGIYQFASKGGPTDNPNYGTDNTVIIDITPKLYGGLQNSFKYKGFQLDFLFQFVKQIAQNYYFGYTLPSGSPFINQPLSVLNRWQKPGDIRPIQRFNSNFNYFNQHSNAQNSSDASFSDASYIRLKNLSLSWQLPDAWKQKAHLQNFRIYVQGQNLLTITHFRGMDPENQSTTLLPPLRVLTLGLQIGL